nr:NAD(P)-dependent oxidoreductase [Alcaligenes sp.]
VFFISADDSSHPAATTDWYPQIIGAVPPIKNPRWYQNNPRASIFSSSAAKDILGWQPSTDFTQLREEYAVAKEQA